MKLKNIRNRNLIVKDTNIHVADMGDTSNPAILFIHGWPTNWSEFEKTMEILSPDYYVLALDLPGIGASTTLLNSYSKANIASYIYELLNLLDLNPIAFVGCDIGGQIVYSFLKKYPDKLSHAVMMHVAIPGINPWESVERNPYLWHFAFHSIPNLPEELVMGHQKKYFSYFYDILCGNEKSFPIHYRNAFTDAYSRLDALTAGFELYRSFPKDIENNTNAKHIKIHIPVLYIRGEKESVNIKEYINGFQEHGFQNISSAILHDCGHFSAIEQPEELSRVLKNFLQSKSL